MRNSHDRNFVAPDPDTRGVADTNCIHTGDDWPYLCTALDVYGQSIVGWSMWGIKDRHMVIKTVLMACWQRPD